MQSAIGSAVAYGSCLGTYLPNRRLRVGVIGIGVRGKYLIGNLPRQAQVVAVCDCSEQNITSLIRPSERFAAVLTDFISGDGPRAAVYFDYRKMIEQEDLDAVIIATPDHHHVLAAMLALAKGCHVYLEKPLSVTIDEGKRLVEAVERSGRILQVGSQQRTMEMNRFACEFIRDGGLGKIRRVSLPNYPGPVIPPRYPDQPIPDQMHWDLFLGSTPRRPYHRNLWVKDAYRIDGLVWRGWDLFRDYSGHLMTNWGAHSVDMVQYALGADDTGPTEIRLLSKVSEEELTADWKRKWFEKTPRPKVAFLDTPSMQSVEMQYGSGPVLEFVPGLDAAIFEGEKGRMKISRNKYSCDPVALISDAPSPSVLEKWKGTGHVARPHLENWLQCIASGDSPNAPVGVGHRSVSVCHLANIVREIGTPLQWDPASEEFIGNDKANGLLARPRRAGFELPEV